MWLMWQRDRGAAIGHLRKRDIFSRYQVIRRARTLLQRYRFFLWGLILLDHSQSTS